MDLEHVPFKHKRTSLERAEKFISKSLFTDVNLRGRLYPHRQPLHSLKHTAVPGRIPFSEVINGQFEFKPVAVGQSFGPVWSTHWFCVEIKIPPEFKSEEVHLLWNSGSESLVYVHGKPVQGLSSDNDRISFELDLEPGRKDIQLYIEMACNHLFGVGDGLEQSKPRKTFTLSQAEIAVFDRDVHSLILDVEALHDMAKELPEENHRGYQALYTVNNMINTIKFDRRSSLKKAHEMAQAFFNQRNGDSQHVLYAMGHAHIDSAWLWPYAETKRKCARSWSCSLRLMEKYKDFKFMCSQAQQYAWVKELYPELWEKVVAFVQKGQFVPVGGTWVEMDGNIPSGEACIRQFVYGQNFFLKEFGLKCKEFWLPDTFGYSAQLPQIMRHCGVTRFLTQKLSWSLVNKFPHHTFHWEGIDGSRVLAHFPPGEDYNSEVKVHQLLKTKNNFQDKGRSNCSALVFGYGDGGHGPSEDMLLRIERFKDCDGIPKVKMADSNALFSAIEKEDKGMLCTWKGELYLELHNGTYTTWALVKKYNRACEMWLRDLELLATLAKVRVPSYRYPKEDLDEMWKLVLLNQFHDVLPGSSITQVFEDAVGFYKDVDEKIHPLINQAAKVLIEAKGTKERGLETYVVNTQPFSRHEVIEFRKNAREEDWKIKEIEENNIKEEILFVEVVVPPMSVKALSECEVKRDIMKPEANAALESEDIYLKRDSVEPYGECFVMDNGIIRAYVDLLGRVLSLRTYDAQLKRWSKEAIHPGQPANQYVIFDDVPLFWDAWDVMDYHLETRRPIIKLMLLTHETNKVRACVEVILEIEEGSELKMDIILDAGSPYLRFKSQVRWQSNRKFLKVEFPTTAHTTEATFDIQSGFMQRPNHYNTSWDSARFEVCGHKWADLSEFGFGVSVMNDCKYGWSAVGNILRMSLLRSPKNPDPVADIGTHHFNYAIMPHFGSLQAAHTMNHALAFNNPLRTVVAPPPLTPCENSHTSDWINIDSHQLVLQACKMAEDGSNDVILRFHEAFGGSGTITVTSLFAFSSVTLCNGLEECEGEGYRGRTPVKLHVETTEDITRIAFDVSPFQILSFRCKPA